MRSSLRGMPSPTRALASCSQLSRWTPIVPPPSALLLLSTRAISTSRFNLRQHDLLAALAIGSGAGPLRAATSKPRRKLPPSVIVADGAQKRMAALLEATPTAVGVRMGMTNDWGSPTGFSYTLSFVTQSDVKSDDERIELESSATLFVERKALWVGEGGLLGATLDLDEDFNLVVTPKEEKS